LPESSPPDSPIGFESSISDSVCPLSFSSFGYLNLKRKIVDDSTDSDDVLIHSATLTENESDGGQETRRISSLSRFNTTSDLTSNNNELDPNVSIPNEDSTCDNFMFLTYGQKILRKEKQKGCVKKYHRCAHKLCEAHYFSLKYPSGKTQTEYTGSHNHQPPEKPHTHKEVSI
jgi:hypothetical protein